MFYLLFSLIVCYAFDEKMLMAQYALSNFKEDYPIFGPKSNFYFGSNKLDIKFSFKRLSTNNATILYIDNKISKMSILTKNSLHEYDDITKAYEAFLNTAENNFTTVKSKTNNWQKCKYERSITSDSKMGKLAVSTVVVKFDNNGVPSKFEFTAIKFNNRWYYYGDAKWVEKAEVI